MKNYKIVDCDNEQSVGYAWIGKYVECEYPIKIGSRLYLYSLNSADWLHTSHIQSVEYKKDETILHTLNSTYYLENLPDDFVAPLPDMEERELEEQKKLVEMLI